MTKDHETKEKIHFGLPKARVHVGEEKRAKKRKRGGRRKRRGPKIRYVFAL